MTEIKKLEEKLGYGFKDKQLLERALTRRAYANEQKQKNKDCEDHEIFSTLGDAVLKVVLVDLLIKKDRKTTKGHITVEKAKLERGEWLAEIGRELEIGSYIIMNSGEKERKENENPRVLAEILEAIIGAIYLDGGYEVSKEVIIKLFEKHLPSDLQSPLKP